MTAADPTASDMAGPLAFDRWTYRWEASRRPFVHPLRTPSGKVLTVDAPDDHPWHHALWFAIKYVNGENFWEEYGSYGVVRHDAEPSVVTTSSGVEVRGALRWIRPDRTTLAITEQRVLRSSVVDADAWALDWDVTLVPTVDTSFDRTPFDGWGGYGGLTLRGRPDWHDTVLVLDDGVPTDRVLGRPSRWCDLVGPVGDADEVAGVAIFDHPTNPTHPTPWYASTRADTYGDAGWSNFLNAAALWDGPIEVEAGEQLRFRHRVIVHDGGREASWIDAAWARWVDEEQP